MTNEEAIEELKRDIHNAKVTHHLSEHYEMAIKALEQEPCEDCISRAKLKEYISKDESTDFFKGWNRAINAIYTTAPSIQPKWISSDDFIKSLEAEYYEDCISRQAVLDAFNLSEKTRKYGGDHSGYDTMMLYEIQDVIEDLPPVQPIRPKGEWIKGEKSLQCPKCGAKGENIESDFIFNYCPCCGAEMESEDKK